MKEISLITFLVCLTITANSQSLIPTKFGIKAGLNYSTLSISTVNGVKPAVNSSQIGISAGACIHIPLSDKWYINPELVYSQKGASFNYDYTQDYNTNNRQEYSTTSNLSIAYIELNPTISYKANHKVSLNLGPSLAFLMSGNYSYKQDPTNQHTLSSGEFNEESLDIGLNFGFSYYINENLLIDSKFCAGLINIGEISRPIDLKEDPPTPAYTLKNRAIVLSLAYLF